MKEGGKVSGGRVQEGGCRDEEQLTGPDSTISSLGRARQMMRMAMQIQYPRQIWLRMVVGREGEKERCMRQAKR